MTDQIPLLPCAFCGGAAEIDTQRAYRSLSTGEVGHAVAIYCIGDCGTDMSLCRADVPELSAEDALAALVHNWNKRADPELLRLQKRDRIAIAHIERVTDHLKRLADVMSIEPCDEGALVDAAIARLSELTMRLLDRSDSVSVTTSHLRTLVYHWNEFGPADGLDEEMHYAHEWLKRCDSNQP